MVRTLSLTRRPKDKYARIFLIGGFPGKVTKGGMPTSFYKENCLKMNNQDKISKVCDWIDHNIGRYIGWNEWGSLRVIDPDKLKQDLLKVFNNYEQD